MIGLKSEKLMHFLKKNLPYLGHVSDTFKCIGLIIKEGSTQVLNFMTPGAGILVMGCGHLGHIVKMHYVYNFFYSSLRHHGSDKLS